MDCEKARERIGKRVDGLLPPGPAAELDAHLAVCPACAAERERTEAVGRLLRAHAAAGVASAAAGLDAMWTRVRAGIAERKAARGFFRRWRGVWLSVSAVAALIVCFAVPFRSTGPDRLPFDPRTFDASVEDIESDAAAVALLDRGEDLPKVIWVIEDDAKS